jgi:hypothetical protein
MAECKGYTQEFKFEAVRLFEQSCKPVAQSTRKLGVSRNRLYRLKVCILSLVTFAVGLAFFAAEAAAADNTYPTRTINMIIACPAGGSTDIAARIIVQKLAPVLSQACQDTFMVGAVKEIGRIYLHAVIDIFGSFAFGQLYTSKLPETAVDVLYDRTLTFYEARGLKVEDILSEQRQRMLWFADDPPLSDSSGAL